MFKERLKELRESKGLTQSQLSEELKIGRASVSNYELGTRTPDIDVLVKISEYFNVTTDYLTGRSKFKNFEEEKFAKKFIDLVEDETNAASLIKLFKSFAQTLSDLTDTYKNQEIIDLFIDSYLFLMDYFKIIIDLNKKTHQSIIKLKEENGNEILNNLFFTLDTKNTNKIRMEIDEDLRNCIDLALKETVAQTGIKSFEVDLTD